MTLGVRYGIMNETIKGGRYTGVKVTFFIIGKQISSRANFVDTAKFNDYFECRLKAAEWRKKWMTAIVRTLVCVM